MLKCWLTRLDKKANLHQTKKNKDSDRITSEKSEEEKYEHQYNLAEEPINSPLEQNDLFKYEEILPKRFTTVKNIYKEWILYCRN